MRLRWESRPALEFVYTRVSASTAYCSCLPIHRYDALHRLSGVQSSISCALSASACRRAHRCLILVATSHRSCTNCSTFFIFRTTDIKLKMPWRSSIDGDLSAFPPSSCSPMLDQVTGSHRHKTCADALVHPSVVFPTVIILKWPTYFTRLPIRQFLSCVSSNSTLR